MKIGNKMAGLKSRKGVAIITAALVVAMAASVASYAIISQDVWDRQFENVAAMSKAESVARAAVDWGRTMVYDDARTQGTRRIGEEGPAIINAIPVDDGELNGQVDDAQAKFNLNNMVTKEGKASERDILIFKRLLVFLKMDTELVNTLTDWMDADSDTRPGGAESEYYLQQKTPYRASNGMVFDLGELMYVKGFDRKKIEALRPYVIALPERMPVNVNTASALVIASLYSDMTLDVAKTLVDSRKGARFNDKADYQSRLPTSVVTGNESDYDISSIYYTVTANVKFGKARVNNEALLQIEGTDKSKWPKIVWLRGT